MYTFQCVASSTNFMQEIYSKLYKNAKKQFTLWKIEKAKLEQNQSKLKDLQLRMIDDAKENEMSPHLRHISQCLDIIEDVEANHKGLTDEKFLNMKEKYKLALTYMEMLNNPEKFKYLDRTSGGDGSY